MVVSVAGPASAGRMIDERERRADGIVHAIGVAAGATGAIVLVTTATDGRGIEALAVAVYALGLVTMLGCSAAYNMLRPSRLKWWLRRADHAAIFLMIAATYTPFMARLADMTTAVALSAVVWTGAVAGMVLKFGWPGRFDRLSVALYLALGWVVVLAIGPLSAAVPTLTLTLLAAGGALYTVGVVFHLWESLRFGTAIWHGFVLAAASCHYGAVLDLMVLSRV